MYELQNSHAVPEIDKKNKSTGNVLKFRTEQAHDKTYKMVCVPSEDSDQPGHPPSLIRVFAVR